MRRAQHMRRKKRSMPLALKAFIAVFVLMWILFSLFIFNLDSVNEFGAESSPWKSFVNRGSGATEEDDELLTGLAVVHRPTGPAPASDADKTVIDMRRLNSKLKFDNPDGGVWKQGWNVGPVPVDENNTLTVFVIPHSHCDPGWIKTFDEYFQKQTRQILTTVYESLMKDSRRKFIWAEISYFEWWWREQSVAVQDNMKGLIEKKQFEFVTGGWVQPDEANTQRYAIEVQLQEGHDWLRATFGEHVIPKYGWSIDPFGYSPTMADILHKYGFKGMLIQRVHYAIKKELALGKNLEFMWRQTWDTAGTHDIFTHVMPFYSYDAPHTCGPDPSVCCQFDFARLNNKMGGCPWKKPPQPITQGNVAERSHMILDQWRKKANLYRSRVVMSPLGDDFRYQSSEEAENQFNNYQKIFDYLNANVPGVKVQFGTLSEYFKLVQGSFEPPLLKGSFFTYADRDEDYWSGYFTSRVFDKALDRKLERSLYAATSLGGNKTELQGARRDLSLFQHHDGVTGTAKDVVVQDYAKKMYSSINFVENWIANEIKVNFKEKGNIEPCWKSNDPRGMSYNRCAREKPVFLYNPLKTPQSFCDQEVPGRSTIQAVATCDEPAPVDNNDASQIKFDSTGMMIHPIKEHWNIWKVTKGGAYLFFPGKYSPYPLKANHADIKQDGYTVDTSSWKRTVVEKKIPAKFANNNATVIDFMFETNLRTDNEEWIVRFQAPISNGGVFHTDLNGFNFDTHYFRADLPIQSQVFPMPTLASIEDSGLRMTILSEHSQGTASFQDGTIDVWLDRRLRQDDERGLGQGVKDNVPTKTKLRVVIESHGWNKNDGAEFEITELCKRMWDELNHPIEMFGDVPSQSGNMLGNIPNIIGNTPRNLKKPEARKFTATRKVEDSKIDVQAMINAYNIPFVYMVHDRIDYLKHAIDSLRASDFPKSKVPLIISHDGRVPDVVSYVQSLKDEFKIIQLFHPYACFDHPNSFPGNDASLNEGYRGDTYGNKRSEWATCARHHWNWMMSAVWKELPDVDSMFFMEEDYVVSPTIYSAVATGMHLIASSQDKYFGLIMDITSARNGKESPGLNGWVEKSFTTGPMLMLRSSWKKIVENTQDFCTFDEYNWDWAVVHLMGEGRVPNLVLAPSIKQVIHIGAKGMHFGGTQKNKKKVGAPSDLPKAFHGTKIVLQSSLGTVHSKGYGGWGHPKDHSHCIEVLQGV